MRRLQGEALGRIVGIDLGTCSSAVAAIIDGRPMIIPSPEGSVPGGKAFGSCVAFKEDGRIVVGEAARRLASVIPDRTVFGIKRAMGIRDKIRVGDGWHSPESITALILEKMMRDVMTSLHEEVDTAVITVPSCFNSKQRESVKDAATMAGLKVARIINESTAAALAYAFSSRSRRSTLKRIMIFHLGGGMFDVSIVEVWRAPNRGETTLEVLATAGDTSIGGIDIDDAIVSNLVAKFKKKTGVDLSSDKAAIMRLREAAEEAKIRLSYELSVEISVPSVLPSVDFRVMMTRVELEGLVKPIVQRCRTVMDQTMKDAKVKVSPRDIDLLIPIGGPTRMPIVRKLVEGYVQRPVGGGVDPMECVAIGAAIDAATITGQVKNILLLDVSPWSIGVEASNGLFLRIVQRNTPIPTRRSQILSTAHDSQQGMTIPFFEGENEIAAKNMLLGVLNFTGIPLAPKETPQIEVTIDIDVNGIVRANARDIATGRHLQTTLK